MYDERVLPYSRSLDERREDRAAKIGTALTRREVQVAWCLAEGLSNKLIAARIGVSDYTVKFHVNNLIQKLNATTRTQAAVSWVLANLVEAVTRLNSPIKLGNEASR